MKHTTIDVPKDASCYLVTKEMIVGEMCHELFLWPVMVFYLLTEMVQIHPEKKRWLRIIGDVVLKLSSETLQNRYLMVGCFIVLKLLQLRPYMVWPLTVFFSKGVLMMYIAGFTQKYPWTPASWIGIWHQQHKQKTPHPPSLQKLFKTHLYSHFQCPINTCLSI